MHELHEPKAGENHKHRDEMKNKLREMGFYFNRYSDVIADYIKSCDIC